METENLEVLTLNEDNIADEHICCGFTDKKIAKGYRLKKELIKSRLSEGFKFKKLKQHLILLSLIKIFKI